jgi:predicted membrane-bound spermidine synthase
LGLQVFFGNIYLLTSFIITGFMLGLAIGTFYGISFKSAPGKEYISITQIVIAIFSAVAGLFLFSSKMAEFAPTIVYALYLISVVLIGGLTGFQFTQVSMQRKGSYAEISGSTYSYDLIGSALGALSVALFLVPNLGIFASALSICLVNLIFGIWLILNKISRI